MFGIGLISVLLGYLAITEAAKVPESQFHDDSPSGDDTQMAIGPIYEESFVMHVPLGKIEPSPLESFVQDVHNGPLSSSQGISHEFFEKLLKSMEPLWEGVDERDKPLSIFVPDAVESDEHAEDMDMPGAPFGIQTLPLPMYHFELHAKNHEVIKPLQVEEQEEFQPPTVEIESVQSPPIPQPELEEEMTEARKAELLKALDSLLPSRDQNRLADFAAYLTYIFLILVIILGFYVFYVRNYNEQVTQLVVDQVKSYDGKTVVLLVPIMDKCTCPPQLDNTIQVDHVYLDVTKLETK